MKNKKRLLLKRVLLALFSVATLLLLCTATLLYAKYNPLPWDTPNTLSGKQDTIEVTYIAWACDCSNWKIIGEAIPEDSLEHYTIFIEAAPGVKEFEDMELPNNCWPHQLRLTGQFYTDKGISRDVNFTHDKPAYARVFRYDSYTATEQRCPPDTEKEE